MSHLPTGWTTAPLAELCLRLVDGSHNPPAAAESGRPMLSARNVNNFQVLFDDYRLISEQDFELENARTQVSPGDVLLTIVGTIGRTAVVSASHPKFALQRSVAVLKPRGIDSQYLAYALSSPEIQQWLGDHAKGTAQKGVYLKTLGTLGVSVAPRAEQTRIVEKLEELLSDLDAGVAELKAAQKKLAQYRQSLLKAAVEGALTAEWRQQHPPAETGAQLLQRILAERRARWEARQLAKFKEQGKTPPKDWQKKYPEPVQPDTSGLPELPQGWVWASVEQLGVVQLGRQRSPDKVKGISPVAYIRAANLTEAGVDLTDVLEMDFSAAEVETFALRPGDVLLTEASGSAEHVGRPAIWRGASRLHCFQNTVLRFRSEHIDAEFSYIAFLTMQKTGVFRRLSGGVGINHLSAGKFSGLPMALPPTDEQAELVRQVMDVLNGCDQQFDLIERSLKQSTAQRQNILRAAFAGQLVPQDPTDEPARVLLERIRTERAARETPRKPRGRPAKAVA